VQRELEFEVVIISPSEIWNIYAAVRCGNILFLKKQGLLFSAIPSGKWWEGDSKITDGVRPSVQIVLSNINEKELYLLDITSWSPLKVTRRFGGTCHLNLQGRRISQARKTVNRWQPKKSAYQNFELYRKQERNEGRVRSSVVGWGTMLQAGKSRVRFPMWSLHFSIDLIVPATLRPCVRLSFW
jgi:hypothetical protein